MSIVPLTQNVLNATSHLALLILVFTEDPLWIFLWLFLDLLNM